MSASPSRAPVDLLRVPGLGRFLRWKHARTTLQVPFLLLAALVVFDGLTGPADAPRNAAGVLPWIHARGFVALALLVAGNLFCLACPFMLPRRLAKKLFPADRLWPAWLRGKWLAVALVVLFFWVYEAWDLWASPWLTAWLVVGYFLAAFVVDAFFRGAAFCKHVCPIGQFNFVNSLASPAEIAVRDPDVCASCETKDCITGRYEPAEGSPPPRGAGAAPAERGRLVQNGCELWLFQPKKVGNMDCTFCLDCIQACPYDNVGFTARSPVRELPVLGERSGLGQLEARPDMAALVLVLVFAAFANAGGMIGPVHAVNDALAATLGLGSDVAVAAVFFGLALLALPAAVAALAAWASRALAGTSGSVTGTATRFVYGLVPVGFGMWVAHHLFHLLGSGLTAVPVLQQVFAGRGWPVLGAPRWELTGILPADQLVLVEVLVLELGLLASLVALWRIARARHETVGTARRAFLPWALVAALLGGGGAWTLDQPMEMRGMAMPGMRLERMEDTESHETEGMQRHEPPDVNEHDAPGVEGQAGPAEAPREP